MRHEPVPFGRYRLLSLLGRGAMASVFRAVLPGPMGFEKVVALKTLDQAVTKNDAYCQALVNEARLGGDLRHRNLVEVYEFDQVGDHYFIAMEYIDGWSLQQLLAFAREQGAAMPPSVAVELGAHICEGLHYAHTAVRRSGEALNLVHRDLKPANIMVSRFGEVRVMDFGVAKADTNLFQTEDIGSTKGTPIYMSPEQVQGVPLDCRSDLFSLGSLLFEVVSLEPCFQGNSLMAVLHAIAQSQPENVVARLPVEAAVLAPVLAGCMVVQRDERYASARDVRRALVALRRDLQAPVSLRDWLGQFGSALPRPRPDGDFGEDGPPVGGVFAEPVGAQPERARASAVAASTASVEGLARTAPLLSRGSLNRGTRSNLSAPMDAFFGREEELEDLANRVSGGQRLITVVGSAGTGKTRLAKRFGAQVVGDLGGGTWFCDLCEARGESGILSAVGAALGVRLTGEDPATQLAEAMGRRGRSLVILDNFEHVAEHAVATLGRWLQAAPEAVFLVTSRALLHLTGEEAFYLDPLPTEEAVVVFYDRARAVQPEFERTPENEGVIRDIVERLDGVLLAIELAAARVRLLTPEAIRDRLSQRFKLLRGARRGQAERHATLQSAIDWSWDLLQPEEKSALAQLSVFRGGCTLEAAETIVDLGGFDGTPWVVDVVESLVDQSLVRRLEPQPGHVRYQMLESIREYAAEKLGDDGSAATRRCVDHFAALGHEDFLDSLHTHGGLDRLRGLSLELENLVAAAEEGLSLGDPDQGAACALAAAVLFTRNGPVSDGLALLHRFSTERLDPVVRANLCRRKGGLLRLAGRDSAAEENHQRALSTYRDLGDHRGEAIALANLGALLLKRGWGSEARAHYREALSLARQAGARRLEGFVLGSLANVDRQEARAAEALEHYRQALEIAREVGDRQFEGQALGQLAILHHGQGNEAEARENYAQALVVTREVGDRRFEGIAMGNLGELMSSVGEMFAADAYLQQAVIICDELWPQAAGAFRGSLALVRARQGVFDEARHLLDAGEARIRGEYPLELAKLLCKRARVEHLAGDPGAARAALEEAESIGKQLDVSEDSPLRRSIAEVRGLWGPEDPHGDESIEGLSDINS